MAEGDAHVLEGAIEGEGAIGFAADLLAAGFSGLLVRSFARGASEADLDLVLWRWSDSLPCRLTVIDDEGRLG